MFLFWSALLWAVPAIMLGFLVWAVLWLFRVRGVGRKVFKWTSISYLIIVPSFVFIAAPLLMSHFLSFAGTRPMDMNFADTPQTCGSDFEDVVFRSRDGLDLSGWYLPGVEDKPPLVVTHGLFRNRHEVLKRSCEFNHMGYPVLLFDFRNHRSKQGASQSKVVSLGYQERLDVLGALDWLEDRLPGRPAALVGVSMGAVAAILAAAEAPDRVSALIVDSPFQNLDETARRHVWLFFGLPGFPIADIFVWDLSRRAGFEASQLNPEAALRTIPDIPLLLIYGGQDHRMPGETAQAILAAAASRRKKLVFFESAGHGRAYTEDPQRYLREVTDFLQP